MDCRTLSMFFQKKTSLELQSTCKVIAIEPEIVQKIRNSNCIRKSETHVAAVDIVGSLNVTNPHLTITRFKKKYPEYDFFKVKFPGKGQRDSDTISFDKIEDFLSKILVSRRISLGDKKAILPFASDITFIRTFVESEYIEKIQEATKHFRSEKQYQIGKYRVDLCYPEQKLLVECDEDNHKGYTVDKETERNKAIATTGFQIIRFDPYNKEFCIFKLIADIYKILISL